MHYAGGKTWISIGGVSRDINHQVIIIKKKLKKLRFEKTVLRRNPSH